MKQRLGVLGIALGVLFGAPLQAQPAPQPEEEGGASSQPASEEAPTPQINLDELKEKVGVLDLDADPGVKLGLLQGNFLQVAEEEIAIDSLSGDKLSSLTTLYGCDHSGPKCLLQVASGLSTRWLVYGYVTQNGESLHLQANLFSATTGQNVSSVEADFSSPADSVTLRAALWQLLSSEKNLLKDSVSPGKREAKSPFRWVMPGVLAAGGAASGVGALLLNQKRQGGGLDNSARTQLKLLSVGADVLLTSSAVWFAISLITGKKRASEKNVEKVVLSP